MNGFHISMCACDDLRSDFRLAQRRDRLPTKVQAATDKPKTDASPRSAQVDGEGRPLCLSSVLGWTSNASNVQQGTVQQITGAVRHLNLYCQMKPAVIANPPGHGPGGHPDVLQLKLLWDWLQPRQRPTASSSSLAALHLYLQQHFTSDA